MMGRVAARSVYVGLGSNLGDRISTLQSAIALLDATDGIRIERVSPWYETDPVGMGHGSPPFLNAVAAITTCLPADALLRQLLETERGLGRRRQRQTLPSSRTVDLDLLLCGDEVVKRDNLTVPHPRLHRRLFVLVPLADVAADVRVPGLDLSVADLLRNLRMESVEAEPRPLVESR